MSFLRSKCPIFLLRCSIRTLHNYCIDPSIGLSMEQMEIQRVARRFAQHEMAPNMVEWDDKEYLPRDVLEKAGQIGFGAINCNAEYGGSSLDRLDSSIIFEQLAIGCVSTAAYMSIHNMCVTMIDTYGTTIQKEKYLEDMARFKVLGSYCLTEPDSGSDAASLRTYAAKDGDHYVVNGSKAFISGSGDSGVYLVMIRHEGSTGPKGIFCLLMDASMQGFELGKKEKKMGWKSQPTRQLNFDNCRVPICSRLGGDNEGFKIAMSGLNGGRINIGDRNEYGCVYPGGVNKFWPCLIQCLRRSLQSSSFAASCSLGAAQASIDLALNHLSIREQFQTPLLDFQHNQFKLAEMVTKLATSRLIVRKAAQLLQEKSPHSVAFCAMAKLHATEQCFDVVNQALQMFGGYGYLKEYYIEQYLRDIRAHQIIEGTNEVMRMIIARDVIRNRFL